MKRIIKNIFSPVPKHLRANWIHLSAEQLTELDSSIRSNYLKGWRNEKNYSPGELSAMVNNDLVDRLQEKREVIVPWLDRVKPLRGAKILEIGCGTGASTLSLAEQGAQIIGIDIDSDALRVAKDRFMICGAQGEFFNINAIETESLLLAHEFDFVIFYAALEHMLIHERIEALGKTWQLMKNGAYLVITETPNRLWYYDDHTALLPFFHWLPDELAYMYSRYSKRNNFNNLYTDFSNEESRIHFLRRGRGFSYHEINLAIGENTPLEVVSCLRLDKWYRVYRMSSTERRFHAALRKINPRIHRGFFFPWLDIVLKKNG